MKLTLKRTYTPKGTFGQLYRDGDFICHTVERNWENNEAFVSCVPEGTYALSPHESPRFGDCYILEQSSLGVTKQGPSQRTHILIHPANIADQLEGCIAPGMKLGVFAEEWAVMESKVAFTRLMTILDGKEAVLEIVKA